MKKIEFDELQQSRRYRYGYQSFVLLSFLILIDTFIGGLGFVWMEPPMNTFILLLAGCTYFICRCIWGDALVGPKETPRRVTAKTAAVIIVAAAAAVIVAGYGLVRSSYQFSAGTGGSGGPLTLACTVMWSVIALVFAVKHFVKRNS